MNGFLTFGTIVISLLLGYIKGVKTKRKKINNENKALKKENEQLKQQVRRMRTIRNDYQIKTGAFKKRNAEDFRRDIILTIRLDSQAREQYLRMLGVMMEAHLDDCMDLFNLDMLLRELEVIEETLEILEFGLGESNIILDVWEIKPSLEYLFNRVINMNEYEITFNDACQALKDALQVEEESEHSTLKKCAVHSHGMFKNILTS